jgi:hypothetical protein
MITNCLHFLLYSGCKFMKINIYDINIEPNYTFLNVKFENLSVFYRKFK